MYCPKCGKKVPDDTIYCPSCGTKIGASDNAAQDYTFSGDDQEGEYTQDSSYSYHEPGQRKNRYEETDYNGGNSGGHHDPRRNTPILITIIAAAAAALIVFAVILVQQNSTVTRMSTNEKTAAASATQSVSSEKATPTPTAAPTAIPAATATPTPTPTAAPTPTATPAPTQAPQVIVVAPTAAPAPKAAPRRVYIDEDYVFPYSDEYYLTDDDLAGKSAWELTVGRNEICARHGYMFNRQDLQDYFDSKEWYYPVGQFDLNSVLNSTELRNMSFIDKYQNAHGLQTN